MDELIQKYAAMHLNFVSIHPFFDGYGLIARLISNFHLIKAGFPPITISKKNRKKYLDILSSCQATSKVLGARSKSILEYTNEHFMEFVNFCKNEYKGIQKIISDAKQLQLNREMHVNG